MSSEACLEWNIEFTPEGPGYRSAKNAVFLTPYNAVFYRMKCFHMLFNVISKGWDYTSVTIVALGSIAWALGAVNILNDVKNATLVTHG